MKKINSILIAAALMAGSLASCTVNDEIDTQSSQLTPSNKEIKFTVGDMTRGTAFTGTAANSIPSFKVYAFTASATSSPYINGGVYTYGTDAYVPDNTYYWPESGNLDFLAVYPADITITAPAGYQSFSYTAPTTIGEQKDLMVATLGNQAKSASASALSLAFSHLLSQISVKAKVSTNLTVNISDVTIKNVKPTGTYNGTTFSVDDTSTATDYSIGISAQDLPTDGTETDLTGTNVLLLVPQTTTAWDGSSEVSTTTGSYLEVTLTAKNGESYVLGNSTTPAKVYFPLTINWASQKHYTYVLNFGASDSTTGDGFGKDANGTDTGLTGDGSTKITFTTTVSSWGDGGSTDVNF